MNKVYVISDTHYNVVDSRYVCVSVEHTNLAPILMAEALA